MKILLKYLVLFCLLTIFLKVIGDEAYTHEAVFIHTDKDSYISGELLAFNTYIFSLGKPGLSTSPFIYTGLLNSQGEWLSKKILPYAEKHLEDAFYLQDTLSTGVYYLVAFTGQEPDPLFHFVKPFYLVNRFDDNPFPVKIDNLHDIQAHLKHRVRLKDMRAGSNTEVLFRLKADNVLLYSEVYLHNNDADTLGVFFSDANGFGKFSFHYDSLQAPYSISSFYTDKQPLDYPRNIKPLLSSKVNDEGLFFSLDSGTEAEKTLEYKLRINQTPNAGVLRFFENNQVFVSHEELGYGFFNLEVLGGNENVVHTETLFNPLRKSESVQFATETGFKPGSRYNISLPSSLTSVEGASRYSISVYDESENYQGVDIAFYYLFQKHLYENQARLPEGVNMHFVTSENIDYYLPWIENMSRGYKPVLSSERAQTERLHQGYTLEGWLIEKESNKGVSNNRIDLNAEGKSVYYEYTYTDEQGYFFFELDDELIQKTLYVFSPIENPSWKIKIHDKFQVAFELPSSTLGINYHDYTHLEESQKIVNINKEFGVVTYELDHQPRFYNHENSKKPHRLFAQPLRSVQLRNYANLDDFAEISREILPALRFRKSGDMGFSTSIVCQTNNIRLNNPVFFLNGMRVNDLTDIANKGSEDIDNIEVLNQNWVYGDVDFPGIVSIYTREDAMITPIPPSALLKLNPNIYSVRFLRQGNQEAYLPDFSRVLYWQANNYESIDRGMSIPLITNNLSGFYTLRIQGVNGKGVPFSLIEEIIVQ